MADSKVSALAADASVTGVEEFYLADAGTSKKVPGTDVRAYVLTDAGAGQFIGKPSRMIRRDDGTTFSSAAQTPEQDLKSYTVPAGLLADNGDTLHFIALFRTAANANTKQIRIKYGASTIIDSTLIAQNNIHIVVEGWITRTGAATQRAHVIARQTVGTASLTWTTALTGAVISSTAAETLSGTVILKSTGQQGTAAAGDILADAFWCEIIEA